MAVEEAFATQVMWDPIQSFGLGTSNKNTPSLSGCAESALAERQRALPRRRRHAELTWRSRHRGGTTPPGHEKIFWCPDSRKYPNMGYVGFRM